MSQLQLFTLTIGLKAVAGGDIKKALSIYIDGMEATLALVFIAEATLAEVQASRFLGLFLITTMEAQVEMYTIVSFGKL